MTSAKNFERVDLSAAVTPQKSYPRQIIAYLNPSKGRVPLLVVLNKQTLHFIFLTPFTSLLFY